MSSKSNTQDELAGFQAEERCRKVATEKEDVECIPESQPTFMRAKVGAATNSPFGNNPLSNSFSAAPFKQSDFKPAIRQQEKKMISEGNWLVGDDSLGRVPIDYPLERTSRFIAEPASVIANRISNCLCLRSIEADFDNKRAIAKCNTLDHVRFRIRLFAPRKEEDGQRTIVEVQKRRGDTISFLRDCRAILNAAEGDGVDVPSEAVPVHINFDTASAMAGELKMEEESGEDILTKEIGSAVGLILRDELDLNIMAFECLIALVDPLRTLPDVALNACKTIVANDSKDKSASEIRGAIAALLRNGSLHDDEGDAIISDFNEILKNLALCLLSKTFANMLNKRCLETAIQDNSEWFLDTLIPSLVDAVKSAKDRPHDALYASDCLSNLLRASKDLLKRADEENALSALEEAKAFGSTHHKSLANATEKGITMLESYS
mmetsp:Transcript_874/g.1401  ORF Transcript_874/g.1401 Transcript_874/m.1401 type:complete len:436 (+) Transcript_874:200-1507(+)